MQQDLGLKDVNATAAHLGTLETPANGPSANGPDISKLSSVHSEGSENEDYSSHLSFETFDKQLSIITKQVLGNNPSIIRADSIRSKSSFMQKSASNKLIILKPESYGSSRNLFSMNLSPAGRNNEEMNESIDMALSEVKEEI